MRDTSGQVRIIGGRLRGRKLGFPEVDGLRPTPDRIRETLFNWLQPVVDGARCLDLFAGSGAFGFEALSRGASHVVMVESDPLVTRQLKENCGRLGGDAIDIRCQDALTYLDGIAEPFDLVFLDPPFRSNLLSPAVDKLCRGEWLAPGARVYVESDEENRLLSLGGPLVVERIKKAGKVWYALLRAPI